MSFYKNNCFWFKISKYNGLNHCSTQLLIDCLVSKKFSTRGANAKSLVGSLKIWETRPKARQNKLLMKPISGIPKRHNFKCLLNSNQFILNWIKLRASCRILCSMYQKDWRNKKYPLLVVWIPSFPYAKFSKSTHF